MPSDGKSSHGLWPGELKMVHLQWNSKGENHLPQQKQSNSKPLTASYTRVWSNISFIHFSSF
jgi:hypothetical protein